jgi:16S rRNA (guanine527-N7)-methyltransferase
MKRRPASPDAIANAVARQPWSLLEAPLRQAGADVDAAIARLRTYARMVLEWSKGVSNLISRDDEARLVERHLLEAVAAAHWLKQLGPKRWLDFGSGAGLPAIPLALAGVEGSWVLVESRRMKALFIRKAIQQLELKNFEIENVRLEDIAESSVNHAAFGGFTSRATQKLEPTLSLAEQVVEPGGHAFLWKGSGREQEMEGDSLWKENWEFDGLLGVGSGPVTVVRFVRLKID